MGYRVGLSTCILAVDLGAVFKFTFERHSIFSLHYIALLESIILLLASARTVVTAIPFTPAFCGR